MPSIKSSISISVASLALLSAACSGSNPVSPTAPAHSAAIGASSAEGTVTASAAKGAPTQQYNVTLFVNGPAGQKASVSSPQPLGLCRMGQVCSGDFPAGTVLTLEARDANGKPAAQLAGWWSACDSLAPTCTFQVTGDIFVQANFY